MMIQLNNKYSKYSHNDSSLSVIEMFPYPSGNLHAGHLRNYIIGDIYFRFRCLKDNKKYIRAMGWDSFGLPAENAAYKYGVSPLQWITSNIENMKSIFHLFGFMYDWNLEINTSSSNYYRVTQKIFEIFVKNKIIYKGFSFVNWDNKDKTILSNEQVINGVGWRSGEKIEKKIINTWFFNLQKYANQVFNDIQTFNWKSNLKKIQKEWIGRSEGHIIVFKLVNKWFEFEEIKCFTKSIKDSFFTEAIAISYEHSIGIKYILENNIKINVDNINNIHIVTDIYVKAHNNKIVPIIISSNIFAHVGTGAIYCAPIISINDKKIFQLVDLEYKFTLQDVENTKDFSSYLSKINDYCYSYTSNKLHDWSISRQRVWGCPINFAYCECGKNFFYHNKEIDEARLNSNSYKELQDAKLFVKCYYCNQIAYIETETLDTFFDSCWYFLAYLEPKILHCEKDHEIESILFDIIKNKKKVNYYIGGIEHANLHLLYTLFFISALADYFSLENYCPFENIINQGTILAYTYKDKNNNYISPQKKDEKDVVKYKLEKMSKSKLNTIDMSYLIKNDTKDFLKIDSLRIMLMSNYPIEATYVWDDELYKSTQTFVSKLRNKLNELYKNINNIESNDPIKIYNFINRLNTNIEQFKLNISIANIYSIYNELSKVDTISEKMFWRIISSIYPIIPYTSDTIYFNKFNKTLIN